MLNFKQHLLHLVLTLCAHDQCAMIKVLTVPGILLSYANLLVYSCPKYLNIDY